MVTKGSESPNFSADELDALADTVKQNNKITTAKFTDVVTNKQKTAALASITAAVNATEATITSPNEVKRKWIDWSCACNKKEILRRKELGKTGDGRLPCNISLSELEEMVIGIIGKPNCYIGITEWRRYAQP